MEGAWGWRRKADGGKSKEWMPQGDRVGWVAGEDLYLEPQAAYSAAVKMAAGTHESLGVSETTLRQRLNEKGLLRSREQKRGVLTVRRTLDGGRRGVLHLPAEALVEADECAGAGA